MKLTRLLAMHLIFFFLLIQLPIFSSQDFQKKALIFGVTGQDGKYLAEFLLNKDYEVHGVARHPPSGLKNTSFEAVFTHPRFYFHSGDIVNTSNLIQLMAQIMPDEIYNLSAQTNVNLSFEAPEETAKINSVGVLRLLETVRMLKLEKKVKFFQASSSELFGSTDEFPQTEKTPFKPCSPYGVSKLYGYWIIVNYRESYGLFACNGIMFNHESPWRGENFVTRKITLAACRYRLGLQKTLSLGNLDAKRDWGYAKDYVEAMWMMLQHDAPEDFVIATGEGHSIREFVECAFKELGIEIEWRGSGLREQGIDKSTGEVIVKVDPKHYRPSEATYFLGNAEKAEKMLNWKPKTAFKELVKIMVEADYAKALKESESIKHSK